MTKGKLIFLVIVGVILLHILVPFAYFAISEQIYTIREISYYSKKENFPILTGTIEEVGASSDDTIFVRIRNISDPDFERDSFDGTTSFRIDKDNYKIVMKNGILDKIKDGDEVSFQGGKITFGDGYLSPILSISTHGETILSFEEGQGNMLDYLRHHLFFVFCS